MMLQDGVTDSYLAALGGTADVLEIDEDGSVPGSRRDKISPIPAPTEEYAATGQQLVDGKVIDDAVNTILGPSFQDDVDEAAINLMEKGRVFAEQTSSLLGLDADTLNNTATNYFGEAMKAIKDKSKLAPLYDNISINLKKYEGYKVDGRDNQVINVPWTQGAEFNTSGITMGGIDIGTDPKNLDLLYDAYRHNPTALKELNKLEGGRGLKQQEAKNFFSKAQIDVSKLRDTRGLSNSYLIVAKKVGVPKVERYIPNHADLPTKLQGALISHAVLGAHKNSFTSVRTAMESGKKEDWEKAYKNFSNYGWKSNTKHNQMRSDEVAKAIRELINNMK